MYKMANRSELFSKDNQYRYNSPIIGCSWFLSLKYIFLERKNYIQADFLFNKNYVPHRRGGAHIVFGADPVGVGISVGVSVSIGVRLSCVHHIS